MSPLLVAACVVLALGVLIVRRRSLCLALISAQSLILAGVAMSQAFDHSELVLASAGLLVRACTIGIILGISIKRTRESRPVRASIAPMTRAVIAFAALLAILLLVPPLGIGDYNTQRAAFALGVLGILITLARRATVIQIMGVIVAENGAILLALSSSNNAVPEVIEMGVIFDLLLIATVAMAFHQRIFAHFGSGDSANLRSLRD